MITNEDIETYLFHHLKRGYVSSAVTGHVSKKKRQKNSTAEDVVIVVIANEYAQRQVADVSVNIYVQDIIVNGQAEADNQRINFLKKEFMKDKASLLIPNAYVKVVSQNTIESPGIDEHIISNRLEINIINE